MSQLQAQVPHPLRHQLPALLSPGGVRAPAIRVALLIFIGQCRLEGSTMQIHLNDVGSGESLLRQHGEEEFVDDARTREANGTLLCASGMGCHHHAAQHTIGTHRHLRAVIEAAHALAFRRLLELIGGQVQARLDERVIEDREVFAAGHEGEASEIGEHGPGPILSVEPQQRTRWWELIRREITTDGRKALTQFLPVATVAPVAKRAEPLEGVSLADDGAGSYHLPTLAPGVARGTDVLQLAQGCRHLFSLGQGARARRLTRAIESKDHPRVPSSIHQPTRLLFLREWATLEIIEKQGAEGVNRLR